MHGLSIDAQLAALREWSKDKTVVGEYVDRGISARSPLKKRPELQQLLRDIEAGKVDLVAFTKLDRWTRNIREYYKAQDVLDAHNVAWKALHEDYETQTAAGRLKVNIMLAVAQDEADRTSERVKAVMDEKRRKGLVLTGNTALGITVVDGHYAPGEDAERIRDAFRHYIATRSIHSLAVASKEILGVQYSAPGVRALLKNENYVTAGVITPETFAKAQEILEVRAVRRSRTDRVYLFSGLLVCPECGRKMTARGYNIRGREYVYYSCSGATKSGQCEYTKMAREDVVEDFCKKRLLRTAAGYNVELRKRQKKPVDVTALRKKLDRLTDLYTDGMISREDFDVRSAPIRDAIRSASLTPPEANTAKIMSALDVYPTLTKVAQKAFWSVLLKRITPTEDGFSLELSLLSV